LHTSTVRSPILLAKWWVIQMDLLAPSGMKTEKMNQVYRLLLLC
jgi:hypothetical protein